MDHYASTTNSAALSSVPDRKYKVSQQPLSRLARAALWYAKHGWPVFPLAPHEKVPLIPRARGGRGCLDATTELEQVDRWWRREPEANVGLAAVPFWVLDVDGEAGLDSLATLLRRYGSLQAGLRQVTGSGGFHYLFAADARIRNRAGFMAGLDTRSAGGYIVAPPSIHPCGNAYTWAVGPHQGALSAAQAWLVAVIDPPPPPPPACPATPPGSLSRYAEAAVDSACQAVARAPFGAQNDTLNAESYSIGTLVGAGLVPRDLALARLVAAGCSMSCKEGRRPWRQSEVVRIVDRALRSGANNPRTVEDRR